VVSVPRVVIAAPGSGQGKTSVATGLLAAFRGRGLTVSPHKVGPDYIDPSYHALAAGRPGRNLDPWLVGEDLIRPLFCHGATTPTVADVAIVEGVMGLFDGAYGRGEFASTAHVATLLQAPVVLVVDAAGTGRTLAALVHGCATFDPRVRVAGVIANRVGSERHAQIVADALAETGVALLGTIGRRDELWTPSRHLGLVPAAERSAEASRTVVALGAVVAASVDLDALLRIARSAPDLPDETPAVAPSIEAQRGTVRVGVAGGAAFTFGYPEQAEQLAAAGAEVVPFDPLRDERLPAGVQGLVIGGGFPEVHAADLSANEPLRREVAAFPGPIAAECAGLLYLARSLDDRPMCGVLDADARMGDRLALGYREAVAVADSVLVPAGTRVRGHEFHRTRVAPPSGPTPAWRWTPDVADGFVQGQVHASYLHLHWAGVPGAAERFVAACATDRVTGTVSA
jgi:cobyrinic acid a,c-diamide synthase